MNKFLFDKNFTHCLRAQVYPDKNAKQRIESIKDFCVKYGFNNVIMMFNGECFNVGHITNEELKPWIEVIKEAKEEFAKVGISTSINPWFEFGHLDRGRTLKEGQNFGNMMDFEGNSTKMVACPLDPNWRKYYIDQMSYYVSEIKPDTLWIEDDFRLHNHDPLKFGGCFCEHHMKKFSEKLGYNVSRDEFVKKILEGPCKEREVYLEVNWETLDGLAKEISEAVKKVSNETSVALMSSRPEMHAVENRNWDNLLTDLSSDGNKIDRIHLPCYVEISPKQYIYDFNQNSMVVRSFIGDDALIYPELENGCFSFFAKSARFLKFQVESAIPLGLSGMTYDIFDFCGNGAQNEFGYGPVLNELTPYLSKVKEFDLKPSNLRGIVFPIDQETVKNRITNKDFFSLIPDDFQCISYMTSFGYSFELSKEKSFKNKTIMLAMQNINNFTNDELIELFKDNFIILDGYAAAKLIDRKLGYLIKAISYKHAKNDDGSTSYEVSLEELGGISDYKLTSEKDNSDPYTFVFDEGVTIKSKLMKYDGSIFGNGVAQGDNFFILPFEIKGKPSEQFSLLRTYQFEKLDEQLKGEFIKSSVQGICSYLYQKDDDKILILTNSNTDIFDNISFKFFGFNISDIQIVDRNGEIRNVKHKISNNSVIIEEKFDYMSTVCLILKSKKY